MMIGVSNGTVSLKSWAAETSCFLASPFSRKQAWSIWWARPKPFHTVFSRLVPYHRSSTKSSESTLKHASAAPSTTCSWRRNVKTHASSSVRQLPLASPPLAGLHFQPVSVIIPVYNEVRNIAVLIEKVSTVMRRRGGQYEIICIDDGSTDGTTLLLKAIASERSDLRAIILSRNFGQTAAMAAGFDLASGDLLVTLDGDLQNEPRDIPRLLDVLVSGVPKDVPLGVLGGTNTRRDDGGYDMVCGWRRERKDAELTRKLPSRVANWLIGVATGVKLHDYGCSLKAYRASLVSSFRLYGEQHRFIPALAAIEGAAICELPVKHHPRASGRSKYGALTRTPRVILDLITLVLLARFRDRPMQFIGGIAGVVLTAAAVVAWGGLWSLIGTTRKWGLVLAWPSVVPTVVLALELALAGAQLLCLGFVAEICTRTYYEAQSRTYYRVREVSASPLLSDGDGALQ